jgi:hypothetical protein
MCLGRATGQLGWIAELDSAINSARTEAVSSSTVPS